ncbi:MAG: M24 family metallopeptidase [bacterium]|nr:M24 family metallopeptidase [bacterium]MDZ4247879.1 M24 family metallopeptidase [Patescibacteria group bacterium]
MSTKLKHIEKAQRITERVFDELLKEVRAGRTERELARLIRTLAKRHGADGLSFDPIVAAGRSAADPHAKPGNRKLRRGQLLMIDLGVRSGGYCSDMTRMVAIGPPTAEARKAYGIVLRAQRAAIRAARAGMVARDLDAVARGIIARAGYGKYFVHALGHGVGRNIHQDPRLTPKRRHRLKAGDVITVEPGIYLPGRLGVRIEDMLVLTARGNRNLTGTPKRLRVL